MVETQNFSRNNYKKELDLKLNVTNNKVSILTTPNAKSGFRQNKPLG